VLGRRVRARRIDRDAIAGGYNRNVGPDRLGGGDIGVAAGGVAFLQFRHAATVERGGIGQIEPDRLGVVGDGAVEVALIKPGGAAVDVGVLIFRIEPERLVIVRDGTVEFALGSPAMPRL
jgi:hypothetical protein